MQYIDYILLALLIVVAVLNIVILLTNSKNKNLADKFADLENDVKDYMDRSQRDTIDSVARQMELSSKSTRETQIALATRDSERFNMFSQTTNDSLDTLRKTVSDMTNSLDSRMTAFQKQTTAQMETLSIDTMEQRKNGQRIFVCYLVSVEFHVFTMVLRFSSSLVRRLTVERP